MIKPNYKNPTIAERSFHELLCDLDSLGIDRDKFVSMFRDLTQRSYPGSKDKNLFELNCLFKSYLRVRVVPGGVRNPLTEKQWEHKHRNHRLKTLYQETFDAIVFPLKAHDHINNARLAIAPEADLMEIQIWYKGTAYWSSVQTNSDRFYLQTRRILF